MRCVALLPCEKLIIDKAGAHSLINVMLAAQVNIRPPDAEHTIEDMPATAIAPSQWWIYTVWIPSAEDVGKQFEQVYQVCWPNGEQLFEARLAFTQKDAGHQQTSWAIVGLPVGQVGNISIKTWLDSPKGRMTETFDTFLVIKHGEFDSPAPVVGNYFTA